MSWMWFVGGTWLAVALCLAVVIGRSIHLATVKAERSEPDDPAPSAVTSLPAPDPPVDRRRPLVRRPNSSPASGVRSPVIGECVAPTQRVPSQHEHGVL